MPSKRTKVAWAAFALTRRCCCLCEDSHEKALSIIEQAGKQIWETLHRLPNRLKSARVCNPLGRGAWRIACLLARERKKRGPLPPSSLTHECARRTRQNQCGE